jgi:hypothetical protein
MAWNWDSKVGITNLLLGGRPRRRAPFPTEAWGRSLTTFYCRGEERVELYLHSLTFCHGWPIDNLTARKWRRYALSKHREPLTHRHSVTSLTTPPLYKAHNTQLLFTFLGGQNYIFRTTVCVFLNTKRYWNLQIWWILLKELQTDMEGRGCYVRVIKNTLSGFSWRDWGKA